MSGWEKKIIDAFISHYFAASQKTEEEPNMLRIRSSVFFPNFDAAGSDEKESYLEAAESLERKGIIKLSWEKWNKGERLKTLSCENAERIFTEAGKPFPGTEADNIRAALGAKAEALEKSPAALNKETAQAAERIMSFLKFLSVSFSPREIGQGIDQHIMEDFVLLLEFLVNPSQLEKITTRALSILLYRDSKHLEKLLNLCNPLLTRAKKSISAPDLSFLERSFPETMISGKIIIEYKNDKTPLVNTGGHILGFPLDHTEEIQTIKLVSDKIEKTVLTIENKETFYALGTPQKQDADNEQSHYDCFLYIGGYFNSAAATLVKILAASGFSFYHAGDLDPDGILILQHIQDTAGKPVVPVRMDAATFNQYRAWARKLTRPMVSQIKKIREETKSIPGLADLLRCIEETGLGVEQEIIVYR